MNAAHSGIRRPLRLARWLAGTGVLWLIAIRLNATELRDAVSQVRPAWLAVAAGLELIRVLVGAASMRQMLNAFGRTLPYLDVLRVNIRSAFFGVAADWIGAAVRWNGMVTHLAVSHFAVLMVMLWETGLVWSVAYALNWALFPVGVSAWSPAERPLYLAFLWGAGPLLTIAAFCWIRLAVRPEKMLAAASHRLPNAFGIREKIRPLVEGSVQTVSFTIGKIGATTTLILIQFFCSAAILYCIAHALEAPLDGKTALWICAFATLAQSLPGALLGWTFRVGLLVVLLPRLGGGSAEQAAVMGVCGGLISLLGAAVGGAEFLFNISDGQGKRKGRTS